MEIGFGGQTATPISSSPSHFCPLLANFRLVGNLDTCRFYVQVNNFRFARHSGVTLTSYKPTNEMLCRLIPLPDRSSSRSQTLIITTGIGWVQRESQYED